MFVELVCDVVMWCEFGCDVGVVVVGVYDVCVGVFVECEGEGVD